VLTMPIRSTCPGCQTPVTVPHHLAGRRARCPHCSTVFATPDAPAGGDESEAFAVQPTPLSRFGASAADAVSVEPVEEYPDVRIELRCEGCGHRVGFPTSDIGTVQECPECGGYIDVPEVGRPPTGAEVERAARA
jgi:uncharacterized paraquat-inducible protein A